MVTTYHTGALFSNIEELRGNVVKEKRRVVSDDAIGADAAPSGTESADNVVASN